ncbi:MAG: cation transporter [Chlorobium sp.]|uniref:heavy-metal-associated domain-containing protein n=1 Tax=Chlorobium sp. TaxID=1095 RepID=UPI0025BCBC10|nr:heavy-metal-associated domain-containing protein [Chlorobium sp.]MCF8382998.1 cation transporter [Chlorobium sp.]
MKKEFRVSGMRCSGCEILVKEAIQELEGVEAVRVSFADGIVAVDYDPAMISPVAMIAVIEEQGFKVLS